MACISLWEIILRENMLLPTLRYEYGKPKLLENVSKVKVIMRSSATKFVHQSIKPSTSRIWSAKGNLH